MMMMIRVVVSMVREYKPITKAGCRAGQCLASRSSRSSAERRIGTEMYAKPVPRDGTSSVDRACRSNSSPSHP
jgi:hypothetical protein